ncbi:hypothetical protein [Aliiruegeria lutimaris]|nr:hypothetical protein [Aliiruegeria lutimaris]
MLLPLLDVASAANGSSPTIPLKNNALQVRKLASKNGVSAFVLISAEK